MMNFPKVLLFAAVSALLVACGSDEVDCKRCGTNEVIVHLSSDLDKINPVLSSSANSSEVERFIFEGFLDIDPETFEYLPILVESRPEITETQVEWLGETKDGFEITYRLRDEATWNDGTPITGYDAAFSLKMIKNPKVDCSHLRPYYDFVIDIRVNEDDPKEFTLVCQDTYFMSEIWSSLTMYPKHHYDPDGLLDAYTIPQLSDPDQLAEISGDDALIDFAAMFHDEKFQREAGFVNGSGPYLLEKWETGQRVVLVKNPDWWGQDLVGEVDGFSNYPDKLIYEIIVDQTTAVTALKDEGVDVMGRVPAKDFVKLLENEATTALYDLQTPLQFSYSYIGLNMRRPQLADKRVRQALSMAVDYESINEVLLYDYGVRTVGPIHPSKDYYNESIEPYQYDLERASQLLDEAGWIDEDGDGVREKEVDGEVLALDLALKLPAGSDTGEKIGLMMQKDLAGIGVKIEIVTKEWTVFLDENKNHDFDMYSAGWIAAPTLADLKQIWHTASYNGGSNYVGFGDERSDEIIESIRYEMNEEVRNQLYFEIQEIIHEEAPYIFLFSTKNKVAIHKRFDNATAHVKRPGYQESQFILQPEWQPTQP